MKRKTLRSALVMFALIASSCGSSDGDAATASSAGDGTVSTAAEATTTTAEQTTSDAPTTTEAITTTTVAETTTTTESAPEIPDPPPAGTGVLTVDGVEFPFTIETCNTEPALAPVGDSIIVFEVRGSTMAEGQPAEARLFRIAPASGGANDSFGWGYATDRDDFETLRSEGSPFGLQNHIIVEETAAGTTFYGPPTQFERTEGISIIDDVDPGIGTIIATC